MQSAEYQVICGDCVDVLPTLPDASIDAVITDPPYPCIKRDYGYWTVDEWWEMMMAVCAEVQRLLKPTGSAVFILQPNSEHVGQMRGWLWEFMAWVCREWNMVQDVWWWNITALPTTHCNRWNGLMRPSIKACIWCGRSYCYRKQVNILWQETARNAAMRLSHNRLQHKPSGFTMRERRCGLAAKERGGVTPFNILPIPNANSQTSAGANGHGAGTPLRLADWWTRYICPPGGVVLDPFAGTSTMGVAALRNGCSYIGIEKEARYCEVSERRLAEEMAKARQLELA